MPIPFQMAESWTGPRGTRFAVSCDLEVVEPIPPPTPVPPEEQQGEGRVEGQDHSADRADAAPAGDDEKGA
jgi:hypothetical protein